MQSKAGRRSTARASDDAGSLRRMPPGHARCAALRGVRGELVVSERQRLAHAAGRHGGARLAARRRGALHRQGRGTARRSVPVPDRRRRPAARPGALQHLLHAVPRQARRRPGHGRAARLAPGRLVPPGPAAPGEARLLLRRRDQRLRRHAGLRGADSGPRSLVDRGLRPHAATEPARRGGRRAG